MTMAKSIYRATESFPRAEMFGLVAQMRRAAVSIASNIAEGQARFSRRDFQHFLRIARGSLAELETQVLLAESLGYLTGDTARDLLAQCDELGRVLAGLIASLPV